MEHKGFTLPELLMAAAILAFCLSAVLLSFIYSSRLNQEARNLTTATTHGELILETLKNVTFSSIATSISNGTYNWNTTTITNNGLTSLSNESITTTSSGSNPLQVIVTVSWNDMQGASRTKVLQTLYSG